MNITGKAKVFGLLGHPVKHSLSPILHHTMADVLGQQVLYAPFDVKDDLKAAVEGAYALNIQGLNVTVPYKMDVIPYLIDIDEKAKKIGAVNTLVRVDGGYKGYNTDMPGLHRAMEADGLTVKGQNFYVLGAGGVARAVLSMLITYGAAKIHIMNRTVEKAQQLAQEFAEGSTTCITAGDMQSYQKVVLTVAVALQATNVGMYPKVDDVVIEDEAFYKSLSAGYDLIFNPYETRFMKLLKSQGKPAYNGLKMLLYQGIIAYEYWNQVSVTKVQADKVYEALLEEALKL